MGPLDNFCSSYCVYYKSSKEEEELACRGFFVLKGLLEKGKDFSFMDPVRRPDIQTEDALRKVLCRTCPFFENDCDFILQEGDALPCGGFIFLGFSIERGMIFIDDIPAIE